MSAPALAGDGPEDDREMAATAALDADGRRLYQRLDSAARAALTAMMYADYVPERRDLSMSRIPKRTPGELREDYGDLDELHKEFKAAQLAFARHFGARLGFAIPPDSPTTRCGTKPADAARIDDLTAALSALLNCLPSPDRLPEGLARDVVARAHRTLASQDGAK